MGFQIDVPHSPMSDMLKVGFDQHRDAIHPTLRVCGTNNIGSTRGLSGFRNVFSQAANCF